MTAMTDQHLTPSPGTVWVLRTCDANLRAYGGFQWPASGHVVAPDWVPSAHCGSGLHGFLRGEGQGTLASWAADARWLIVEVRAKDCISLGGKVKFPSGTVVHCGDRSSATALMQSAYPSAAVIGSTLTGGDGSTLTGGYGSVLTGGYGSVLTGGDGSTLTGGDGSTLTGGDGSTLTGGHGSTLTGGHGSTLTGGCGSVLTGGDRSTLTGGDGSTLAGGYRSTLTGGYGSVLTGGYGSVLTGGDGSTLTGGDRSTLTGGDGSVLTGGDGSTLTGGYGSVLIFLFVRAGFAAATVDNIKLQANVAYAVNRDGQIVEVARS